MRAPASDQLGVAATAAYVKKTRSTLSSNERAGSTPAALKRTQGCLRRQCSPSTVLTTAHQRGQPVLSIARYNSTVGPTPSRDAV